MRLPFRNRKAGKRKRRVRREWKTGRQEKMEKRGKAGKSGEWIGMKRMRRNDAPRRRAEKKRRRDLQYESGKWLTENETHIPTMHLRRIRFLLCISYSNYALRVPLQSILCARHRPRIAVLVVPGIFMPFCWPKKCKGATRERSDRSDSG